MNMRISMDELINAVCLHMAMRRQVQPTDVQVELCWDEEHGFTAEVWIHGRQQYLVETNLLEAVEQYVYKEYGQRVFRHQITLDVDDEIWADIDTSQ
ncbi:YxcD family protein [Paenibacillus profundus]|uniref:YxcD family protein n=1 Tax=Paenibacillus profundus TaxID=1173085 RepID=A0ABS8YBR3_9BACL|nr:MULTISPECIES: YxcD family protein [Paenibacillus]MCE5169453.1 YxcD family protein [Paenibacillus profundus]